MANKIFVSHKFGDNQVDQSLDQKYWAEDANEATGRGYVNRIEEVVGQDNIYKGESDGESLVGKIDKQIWEYLKPKIHDSTVTIVAISRGMKDVSTVEADQWIPQEIRYSLWENDRGGRTSVTNALLGVIIPDRGGGIGYVWGNGNCDNCRNISILKVDCLFGILHRNIFNKKADKGQQCRGLFCGTRIFTGNHSYLHLISFDEFIKDPDTHITKALEIQTNKDNYDIEKTI